MEGVRSVEECGVWSECGVSVVGENTRTIILVKPQTADIPAKGNVMSSFSREAAHIAPSVTSSFSKNSRHCRYTNTRTNR